MKNFKQWLNENWGHPDDPTKMEARPGAVVYKWTMQFKSQEQWDKEMHSAREMDRSLTHSKENPFKANTEYEKGSGGEPPLIPGKWEMHKYFKLGDEDFNEPDWGHPPSVDVKMQRFMRKNMEEVNSEAKNIVKNEPDVFASMVMLVEPRGYYSNFTSSPTRVISYFIATSKSAKGKKNITSIQEKYFKDVSQKNQTQINNALHKQVEEFGTKIEQYAGFNRASSIRLRDVMHADVFDKQYRSWKWQLVLTPEGWQVEGSDHGPIRTLGGDFLSNTRKHYITAIVHHYGSNWEIEDVYVPKANLSAFQRNIANARRRNLAGKRPNSSYGDRFTDRYDDRMNVQQGDTYVRNSEEFDRAVNELANTVPWLERFRKVMNPFLLSKPKWNNVVEVAIMKVLDDEEYARNPTIGTQE